MDRQNYDSQDRASTARAVIMLLFRSGMHAFGGRGIRCASSILLPCPRLGLLCDVKTSTVRTYDDGNQSSVIIHDVVRLVVDEQTAP